MSDITKTPYAGLTTGEKHTLRNIQDAIGDANRAKGFHDEGTGLRATEAESALRNYWITKLALMTTEAAEAIEELRNGRAADETWYSAKTPLGLVAWNSGERPNLLEDSILGKPEGVPSEVADIVIRAFDFAAEAGIDLAAIIDEKLRYNATRPHMHGKTV